MLPFNPRKIRKLRRLRKQLPLPFGPLKKHPMFYDPRFDYTWRAYEKMMDKGNHYAAYYYWWYRHYGRFLKHATYDHYLMGNTLPHHHIRRLKHWI